MMCKTLLLIFILQFSLHPVKAQQVLSQTEIAKLLPNKLSGYYKDGDTKASIINVGNLKYSLCERRFAKGKQKIKMLLFDYKEASIMYNQAVRKWAHDVVVTDSLVLRNITMEEGHGWETYNRQNHSSQIFLGIRERFFLMISADNVPLDDLQEILKSVPLRSFPD